MEAASKKKGWYAQIGMSQQNFEKLKRLQAMLEKAMGVSLSWNDFVSKVMPHIEKGVKEEVER